MPQPCFVAYTAEVTFAGGEPVVIATRFENGFQVTGAKIKVAVSRRAPRRYSLATLATRLARCLLAARGWRRSPTSLRSTT